MPSWLCGWVQQVPVVTTADPTARPWRQQPPAVGGWSLARVDRCRRGRSRARRSWTVRHLLAPDILVDWTCTRATVVLRRRLDHCNPVNNQLYWQLIHATRCIHLISFRAISVKPGTHWRQSRLLPKLATLLPVLTTNRQHLEFDSLSRSTLLPTRSTSLPIRRLCRQCVRGQSVMVDFVDFQQSRPCWMQLCRQCVPGFSHNPPRDNEGSRTHYIPCMVFLLFFCKSWLDKWSAIFHILLL